MIDVLHIPTVHLLFALITSVAAAALFAEGCRVRRPYLWHWSLAYALMAGMEVASLLQTQNELWRTAGTPLVRMIAFSLLTVGCLTSTGRRLSLLPFLLPSVWVVLWLLRWHAMPDAASGFERQVVASLGYGLLAGATAVLLWTSVNQLMSEKALAVVFAIHAAALSSRVLITGSISLPNGMGSSDPVFAAYLLESLTFASVSAFLFVGLAKEGSERRWRTEARTDALTGVLNRRGFQEAADAGLRRGSLTLALFDLDHFKTVNDTLGHAFGDEVLRVFARTLSGGLEGNAVFGRIGGEEFAAVIETDDLSRASERLRPILDAFRQSTVTLLRLPDGVTASAGLVVCPRGTTLESMLPCADERLYAAKQAGRNRIGMLSLMRQDDVDQAPPVVGRVPGVLRVSSAPWP